ncbi:hypothetical protein ACOSQ2_007630 [Xanthoceras sorbifolium]
MQILETTHMSSRGQNDDGNIGFRGLGGVRNNRSVFGRKEASISHTYGAGDSGQNDDENIGSRELGGVRNNRGISGGYGNKTSVKTVKDHVSDAGGYRYDVLNKDLENDEYSIELVLRD